MKHKLEIVKPLFGWKKIEQAVQWNVMVESLSHLLGNPRRIHELNFGYLREGAILATVK